MTRVGRLVLVGALVLGACSSGGGSSSKSATNSASSSASSAPSAPQQSATAQLAFEGDASLAGSATNASVRCDLPDVDGPSIAVLAQAPNSAFQFRIGVLAGKVSVLVFSGSGADFHQRAFEGSGVTGFTAANGAQVDARLSDAVAPSGSSVGSIGAVTSIKGSVDCKGQKPGFSGLKLTGNITEGPLLEATLEHARVECNAPGNEVVVIGLLPPTRRAQRRPGARLQRQASISGPLPGSATITSTDGHADGKAIEQDATPPHTIRVVGDVTCGTPVS